MEFLVRLDNQLPAEYPEQRRLELRTAERARAQELRSQGTLVRLWRLPGTRVALGLFDAPDATLLHDALSSLPTFPWMQVEVTPLATHPQERTDTPT